MPRKKPVGRPKKEDYYKKSDVIHIRLTHDEKLELNWIAQITRHSRAELIRMGLELVKLRYQLSMREQNFDEIMEKDIGKPVKNIDKDE